MASNNGLGPINGSSLGMVSKITDDVMNVFDSIKAVTNNLFKSKSNLVISKPAKYTLVISINEEAVNRIEA